MTIFGDDDDGDDNDDDTNTGPPRDILSKSYYLLGI
jgi:hypothetical protein